MQPAFLVCFAIGMLDLKRSLFHQLTKEVRELVFGEGFIELAGVGASCHEYSVSYSPSLRLSGPAHEM